MAKSIEASSTGSTLTSCLTSFPAAECRDYESFDQKAFGRFYNLTFKLMENSETAPLDQAWRDTHPELEANWFDRKILKTF